ncbi:hypothetical protein PanWU01x14_079390 [Parasponia andersonii]|uniref:Uncharacterized protein n=1 Tax=Parasponia andersonii TaxID=3476 RepID=A0A2P5DBA1_PARAD|nr:hypothetical protein PanWU01x14_079390 [Parasponia andersonii]
MEIILLSLSQSKPPNTNISDRFIDGAKDDNNKRHFAFVDVGSPWKFELKCRGEEFGLKRENPSI